MPAARGRFAAGEARAQEQCGLRLQKTYKIYLETSKIAVISSASAMHKEFSMHGMNRRCRTHWGERAQTDGPDGPSRGRFGRGHRHGHDHDGHRGGRGFGRGGLGEDGFGGGPGGGRRRGKRFAGEELRLMVLGLLEEGPRHGYELIRAFAEKSGEGYSPSPGVLYPLLTMLSDMELVAEVPSQATSRRSYALTDAGKAEIDGARERLDALFARLAAMADDSARGDAAPVRRAMMNLRTATMQRLSCDEAEQNLAFDIAALIDAAAQQIERL
jgi:DNA-binding PadR family transcriptional regulator